MKLKIRENVYASLSSGDIYLLYVHYHNLILFCCGILNQ